MSVDASVVDVTITPIAVQDPPLLNSVGVHQAYGLRSILEVRTDTGLVGISEAYGDDPTLDRLRRAAPELTGLSIWDLQRPRPPGRGRTRRGRARQPDRTRRRPERREVDRVHRVGVRGRVARSAGQDDRPAGLRPARGRRPRRGAVLGLPVLQVGRPLRSRPRTRSARLSTRPASSPRHSVSSTGTVSDRSNSRAASSHPTRRSPRSTHSGTRSPGIRCGWTPTRTGRSTPACGSPRRSRARWNTWRTRPTASPAWPRWPRARACRSRRTCA